MKERIVNFSNCKIDLSKKVFVPRLETKFWARKAVEEIKLLFRPFRRPSKMSDRSRLRTSLDILDMFSGTGCIGIYVLKNIEEARIDFVDVSEEAIEQIKINLKINKIPNKRYRIYQSNMFEELAGKRYDVVFANPPYVAEKRIDEVQKQVLETEPHIALFAGRDGMFYIQKFLEKVKKFLEPRGVFFLEFDPFQKAKIQKILKKQGFEFEFRKDQFEKCRWLKASLKHR